MYQDQDNSDQIADESLESTAPKAGYLHRPG